MAKMGLATFDQPISNISRPGEPLTYRRHQAAMFLGGAGGSSATSPHTPALNIAGDMDLRFSGSADRWMPAAAQSLLSHDSGGANRGWILSLEPTGALRVYASVDGTNLISAPSNDIPPLVNGRKYHLRATVLADNSAAGWDATFYWAEDGGPWIKIGGIITTPGVLVQAPVTAVACVGCNNNGNLFTGKINTAEVYDGIDGTLVCKFDANDYVLNRRSATTWNTYLSGELLVNHDFATGSTDPWLENPEWDVSEVVNQQLHLVELSSAVFPTFIQDSITLDGQIYEYDTRALLNAGTGTIQIEQNNNTAIVVLSASQRARANFTAAYSGSLDARFGLRNNGNAPSDWTFDYLSIREVCPWTLNGGASIHG